MADCKLTPEITEIICQFIEKGNSYETATQAVGICRKTLFNWMDRGEKGEPDFTHFTHSIKKARAKAEMRRVQVIEDASPKNWQAAAWLLERSNPQQWGNKQETKIEHSGKIEGNIIFNYKVIEDAATTTGSTTPASTKTEDGVGSNKKE